MNRFVPRTPPALRVRRAGALAVVAAAVLGSAILSPTAPALASTRSRESSLTVTVLSVSPSTPAVSTTARPVTITASIRNTTAQNLLGVSLAAERGDPIGTQAALDASLADTGARSGGRPIEPVTSVPVPVAAHATVTATFTTTTSRVDDGTHLCLCLAASVYPIDVTARSTVDGTAQVLGGARTYLPAFDVVPTARLGVTWIWPLVDRPHRTSDGSVFTDDDLSSSVAGGRLDRALQVVEGVASQVPMTLVVDPDLLDELEVMSRGPYTVQSTNGTLRPGQGQQAASAWLARLRAVLDAHPALDLQLTAPGDPDVTGLARNGQGWTTALTAVESADVTAALAGVRPSQHTLAWPPSGAVTRDALDGLARAGATTVVLDGSGIRPNVTNGIPVSLARLTTSTGSVNALVTSPALQRSASYALAGSPGTQQDLLAELAVRVAQQPTTAQNAILSAPRYVDPAPAAAIATILSTVDTVFSRPVSADMATAGAAMPTAASSLSRTSASSTGLSDDQLRRVVDIAEVVPAVSSLIGGSTAGRQVIATAQGALQRAESAAWSSAGSVTAVGGGPTPGQLRAQTLHRQLVGYLRLVRILTPSSGSYTLASSNSPLPISVRTDSSLPVQVDLGLSTVGGLPGFSASDIGTVQVGPNTKATFKIPTHIQRSGRIPVQAELRTPSNYALGRPVQLFVHSTVLGTIGVVITVVAGAVLVLALLVRYVRRVLRIRRKRALPSAAST